MRCAAVAAAAVAAVAVPAAQDWQIQETTDPLDDSRGITVALESPAGPTLIAGCVSGETRAFISWGDYLGLGGRGIAPDNHHLVTIRVGSAEAVVWYLPISNNKTATFINGGLRSVEATRAGIMPWANTEAFLRALVQADTLLPGRPRTTRAP